MNYSGQAPNGPFTVADQVAFLRINSGTRLIGAPDRLRDKLAAVVANNSRADAREKNAWNSRVALHNKGFSIGTANNYRQKNHRN